MAARVICSWCNGRGEYRGLDAAGSVDDIWCANCGGSGTLSAARAERERQQRRVQMERAERYRAKLDAVKAHLAPLSHEQLSLISAAVAELCRRR